MAETFTDERAPRTIFLDACSQIAGAFAVDGFKFAVSGPHLTKSTDQFKFGISFQSSHDNKPGIYVALWMYANVRSPQLEQWRKRQSHPYRTDDWLAGGMVHNLVNNKYFEWNLADDTERAAILGDAISFIRAHILPYFNTFSDPAFVISKLCQSDIPEFEIGSAIEFALCFGDKGNAQNVLNRFVQEREDLSNEIEAATRTFRERGLRKSQAWSYAEQVAWVRSAYGLC